MDDNAGPAMGPEVVPGGEEKGCEVTKRDEEDGGRNGESAIQTWLVDLSGLIPMCPATLDRSVGSSGHNKYGKLSVERRLRQDDELFQRLEGS